MGPSLHVGGASTAGGVLGSQAGTELRACLCAMSLVVGECLQDADSPSGDFQETGAGSQGPTGASKEQAFLWLLPSWPRSVFGVMVRPRVRLGG